MNTLNKITICFLFGFIFAACNEPIKDVAQIRKLTFMLTNDVHGHLEAKTLKDGRQVGGVSYFAELVHAFKNQSEYKSGASAFFTLDAGDQFQGTLLSNYDEGKTVFKAFNEVGYDAVVPGNHDYDFGPMGWLYDKVTPGQTSNDPREVIGNLASIARFPLLSANTYLKNSIARDLDSQCKPQNRSEALNFSKAERPAFLKPYTIITKAGVRVALIGLDHHSTATITTPENVSDLCFRDEVETYLEIRRELVNQADVFVLIMHNGNSGNSFDASNITRDINAKYPNGVNLVVAGHTHAIHNNKIENVSVIQDGSGGVYFGMVNLFWDARLKKIIIEKTESEAGIEIAHDKCVPNAVSNFCTAYPVPLKSNKTVDQLMNSLQEIIAPIATQVLATATEVIDTNRVAENAMGNILTDYLRAAAGTQIAFMNMGGIRAKLNAGVITYSNFFEVLPFNNLAVTMNAASWSTIKKALSHSIQTCGQFGVLVESGLKIQYRRTCAAGNDIDLNAKLTRVETVSGELLFDLATETEISANKTFSVATLDFIAAGGSGYDVFKTEIVSKTNGIARELIVQELSRTQPVLTNSIDHRMMNINH